MYVYKRNIGTMYSNGCSILYGTKRQKRNKEQDAIKRVSLAKNERGKFTKKHL